MNGAVELAKAGRRDIERRTMALSEFVTGPGKTALGEGEIVTALECDSLAGYGGAFEKVGQRRSLVISTVCTACCVKPSADGRTFEDVRLTMGGIGPVPVRLGEVEAFLRGKPITAQVIAHAAELPTDCVRSRTRQDYRKTVVRGFIERALVDALNDCGVTLPAAAHRELAHA
jgi:CO/xanthine dehydrogenase FAD-binding subunit